MSVQEIYKAIKALPEEDQYELIDKVCESLPGPRIGIDLNDPDLEEELDRRAANLEGSMEWSELRDERRP